MSAAAVRVGAGHRQDAAEPGREAPADLRLVPPALATWGAAALVVGRPGQWAALGAALCLAAAGALVAGWAVGRRGTWAVHRRAMRAVGRRATWGGGGGAGGPGSGSGPGPVGGSGAGRGERRGNNLVAAAAVLLCAAAGAATAGLHGADVRRGPLPGLAREHARVTVELTVTSDPRPTRPKPGDARGAPPLLLLNGEVTRVTTLQGATTATRNPVLLIVRADAAWARLLPSTGLRVTGRLVPPLKDGDRLAAVLRADPGPPGTIAPPTSLQRVAGGLRAGLREATDGLAPDARSLLPGLVVGDTSRVTPELYEAFETTDLLHLLAVSGANLTIVLVLLVGPPGRALRSERGGLAPRLGIPLRATALIGGGLTLAFVIVCRPEPSVLRAAACGAIALLAIGTGRRRSLVPALAAAVLLLVLYDPWLARSPGFLLSVLATGSLLTLAPRWSLALRRRRVPPRIAEALAAAAAAQAVCAPVVAVLAARVSLVAVPCNLLAEFAVAPATVLGFAALATAPLAMPVARALATAAGWPTGWIADVARTGAGLPGAAVDWPGSWRGGLLLAALTAAAVLCARRLPRRPWVCAAAALLLVLAVLRPAPLTRTLTGWPPPGWAFAMCDVGQGDALVLAAGEGTAVVVDAGPDPRPVDRCLRELGVTRVPLLLLTHFHGDHVRGLPGVLRGRSVGAIQTTGFDDPPEQAGFVRRTAAGAHVPLLRARSGEARRVAGLSWRVLWPAATGATGTAALPEGPNDASVTLLVRTAGLTLLLLGDLEPPAQRGLLRAHPDLPRVDVLKVAHHGSAYQDPALLRAAGPGLALISCGRDNDYGHPAPRTVDALRAAGARVLRTDRHGTIAVAARTAGGAGKGAGAVGTGGATAYAVPKKPS
ncbi:ComEC/Rec2 family competence protein [Streptomyces sp. NPDC050504]|uniref:ComEC/Rec2 family competence protein n=1 Tax=Streptomyces sp. NPDC050504 TaxID=3365618 RepID=UPI00378FD9AD